MTYAIRYRASVHKDMRGLDRRIIERIDTAILALADDPRPSGCVKLAGLTDSGVSAWEITACCMRFGNASSLCFTSLTDVKFIAGCRSE